MYTYVYQHDDGAVKNRKANQANRCLGATRANYSLEWRWRKSESLRPLKRSTLGAGTNDFTTLLAITRPQVSENEA
jgi:hypothetical protein